MGASFRGWRNGALYLGGGRPPEQVARREHRAADDEHGGGPDLPARLALAEGKQQQGREQGCGISEGAERPDVAAQTDGLGLESGQHSTDRGADLTVRTEESIDDAGAPTRIRWHEGSFIEIPAQRRNQNEVP